MPLYAAHGYMAKASKYLRTAAHVVNIRITWKQVLLMPKSALDIMDSHELFELATGWAKLQVHWQCELFNLPFPSWGDIVTCWPCASPCPSLDMKTWGKGEHTAQGKAKNPPNVPLFRTPLPLQEKEKVFLSVGVETHPERVPPTETSTPLSFLDDCFILFASPGLPT